MSVPAHLHTVVQQARAFAARGELRRAYGMVDDALDAASMTLGADHPEVLAANRLLARLHTDLGELPEARRLLEEALAAGHFRLGDEHPIMLGLAYDLALIADELGNLHEARRNYTLLARVGPTVLGDEHEYVRAARGYLGGGAAPTSVPEAPQAPAPPPDPLPAPPEWPPLPGSAGVYRSATSAGPAASGAPDELEIPPLPSRDPFDGSYHLPSGHSRAPLLVLIVIAVLALLGGTVATVAAFRISGRQAGGPASPRPTPTVDPAAVPGSAGSAGPAPASASPAEPTVGAVGAPTEVRITDEGTAVTLSWTVPGDARVPFVVAGGQPGQLRALNSTAAGETTFTLRGVNPRLEYCFTIGAVYDVNQVALSDVVCTNRTPATRPTG